MDFYRPPTNQGAIDALGSVYRALRAWKFYPKGHPTRRGSIKHAHSAMLMLLDGNDLSLSCSHTGFSFPDGERITDATRLTVSLSYELFIRRIQKITFQHDLFQEDLLDFVKILTQSPETIQKLGGVDNIMAEHGIRSIWTNEFDLSVIRGKRSRVESAGIIPQALDEAEGSDDPAIPFEQQPLQADDAPPEQQLQALLERLATTSDEDIYAMLLRQAIGCADMLIAGHELSAIIPLVELLARHAFDETRSPSMREFDRFALEQLSMGDEFLRFLFDRMERSDSMTKIALQAIISAGGPSAIKLAAEQMGNTGNVTVRKTLATLLSSLGEEAVTVLLGMIGDKRWYFIRNICAIFGSIASYNATPALVTCLNHTDIRVRKEAIRSLAKIGGRDAESALIGILRGSDKELYPQAMASLGGVKSRKALVELTRILSANDMFLKSLPLKMDALAAIATIGDRQVTPLLVELLTERRLLASNRGKLFKVAIAQCLGKLGDIRALPALRGYASSPGELGAACGEAVELIERSGGMPDGSI